jgi:hypothetical protein
VSVSVTVALKLTLPDRAESSERGAAAVDLEAAKALLESARIA